MPTSSCGRNEGGERPVLRGVRENKLLDKVCLTTQRAKRAKIYANGPEGIKGMFASLYVPFQLVFT